MAATDVANLGATAKRHSDKQLIVQQLQRQTDAILAVVLHWLAWSRIVVQKARTYSQPPDGNASNPAVIRPHGQSFEDITASTNSAVKVDLNTPLNCVHNVLQSIKCGYGSIELTTSVIRYNDAMYT